MHHETRKDDIGTTQMGVGMCSNPEEYCEESNCLAPSPTTLDSRDWRPALSNTLSPTSYALTDVPRSHRRPTLSPTSHALTDVPRSHRRPTLSPTLTPTHHYLSPAPAHHCSHRRPSTTLAPTSTPTHQDLTLLLLWRVDLARTAWGWGWVDSSVEERGGYGRKRTKERKAEPRNGKDERKGRTERTNGNDERKGRRS
ncbi:hypothetical protein BJ508DRAFT_333028 [Ascobolus immersus RN42]|uniref:Uncharacterized protein n=1 Tax=Ascobolus immersus RN42 TaxID=1160509 RepID=A0A3N4HKZ0_ASCIM|nr:hypothetical protein BJ508DRAFT_333028 [Ascobolus immersus RN42]